MLASCGGLSRKVVPSQPVSLARDRQISSLGRRIAKSAASNQGQPATLTEPWLCRSPGLTVASDCAMIASYWGTTATVTFSGIFRYSKCKVIDAGAGPGPDSLSGRVVPGWLRETGQGIAIVFTAPQVDTTISPPSHQEGAPAGLAWPETTKPHTDARHTEKHLVQEAVLPVYYLTVLVTPSLIATGLPHIAATCPQVGGALVLDGRHAGASARQAGRTWSEVQDRFSLFENIPA